MTLTAKDYASDQEVRWCPGCGDYSILKQVQTVLAELETKRENTVFISGIGCSSRFPYYLNTYGMHSIHGRAAAVATGLKVARPELDVWVITGDGDGLSIGGNHTLHMLRRNVNLNVLLFNNEIYGLTKGQYSPTSEEGKLTKSSPMGVADHPFNPISLALGADATFVARTLDRDPIHLREILKEGKSHHGSSFIEIYQNCNVFNDGAFDLFTDKKAKAENTINLHHGQPLIFGLNKDKGIRINGLTPEIVTLDQFSAEDLWIHDTADINKAWMLSRFFYMPVSDQFFPRPLGIFYKKERNCYEDLVNDQVRQQKQLKGKGDLNKLLQGKQTWLVG